MDEPKEEGVSFEEAPITHAAPPDPTSCLTAVLLAGMDPYYNKDLRDCLQVDEEKVAELTRGLEWGFGHPVVPVSGVIVARDVEDAVQQFRERLEAALGERALQPRSGR